MSEITYTTKFKLIYVEVETKRIELSDDAWIEIDNDMKQAMPLGFEQWILGRSFGDGYERFSQWNQYLFDSTLVICTRFSAEGMEFDPFENPDCSHIALALAIFLDCWFIAGIEYFSANNGQQKSQPTAPYITIFNGKGNCTNTIHNSDLPILKMIYEFVYSAFRTSTRDEEAQKLIALYAKCIVKTSAQSVLALKFSFQTLFSGLNGVIIYSNIYFEHIFTTESWSDQMKIGVKTWNSTFSSHIVWEEIYVVHQYRTTLVHDNVIKAKNYVDEWKRKNKISDVELLPRLEEISIRNVKLLMRTIALNYDEYPKYRALLTTKGK